MKPFFMLKTICKGQIFKSKVAKFSLFLRLQKDFILKIEISNGKVAGKSRAFIQNRGVK